MFRFTLGASLVAQMVKNMPVMQELQVWSQGQEDPLEEEVATQSSIPAWEIPSTEESGGLQSIELQRVRHSSVQFSHSVMSNSLWSHGVQHTRLTCSSPTPGVYSTHIHWVVDAIQTSHLLLSPSPPTFNLSQYQGLFQWVSSSHQVAEALEFQLQDQSFQWIFGTGFL